MPGVLWSPCALVTGLSWGFVLLPLGSPVAVFVQRGGSRRGAFGSLWGAGPRGLAAVGYVLGLSTVFMFHCVWLPGPGVGGSEGRSVGAPPHAAVSDPGSLRNAMSFPGTPFGAVGRGWSSHWAAALLLGWAYTYLWVICGVVFVRVQLYAIC